MFKNNRSHGFKRTLIASAVLAVLPFTASTSLAQDDGLFQLEEIVVTAQKRTQSLQDVSISVSAFDSDRMSELGLTEPKDLDAYTPNLNVKNATGNGNPIFTIRGVGVSAFVGNANPSVGLYVDEVYLPTNMLMSFALQDMERVEVVKGPQGTLFGRNTTGGAVSFSTTKASQEEGGYIDVDVANYDRIVVEAAYGGGLTDTLAGRVAIKQITQNEGYFKNRTDGGTVGKGDVLSGRVSLLWEPKDDLSVHLSVHAGQDKGEYYPWDPVGIYDPNAPTTDARYPGGVYYGGSGAFGFPDRCGAYNGGNTTAGALQAGSCVDRSGYNDNDGDPFEGDYTTDQHIDNEAVGGVLRIEKDFDDLRLISVSGYENFKRDAIEEFDSGPSTLAHVNYDSDIEAFSQELRLESDGSGDITWMTGLFYSKDTNETKDLYRYGNRFLADLLVDYEQTTEASAVFAHVEWSLSDEFSLITGLRYTSEETEFEGGTSVLNPIADSTDFFGFDFPVGVITYADKSTDNTAMTGKVGIDYRPSEDWLVYASVNRGFKSGGFSGFWTFVEEETEPYDEEVVTSYEAGFKSTLMDGRMQLNATAFFYDYEDLQLFALNENFAFVLTNADKAEVLGAEVEWRFRASEGLDLIAGIGYLNKAEVTEFETSGFLGDFNGKQLPDSPEWNFTGTVRYEWSLSDELSMAVMGVASYKSEAFHQIGNEPVVKEDSYWVLDTRLSLTSVDGWEVSLWGKNIGDKEYYGESILIENAGVANRSPGAPLTYGLKLSYAFD